MDRRLLFAALLIPVAMAVISLAGWTLQGDPRPTFSPRPTHGRPTPSLTAVPTNLPSTLQPPTPTLAALATQPPTTTPAPTPTTGPTTTSTITPSEAPTAVPNAQPPEAGAIHWWWWLIAAVAAASLAALAVILWRRHSGTTTWDSELAGSTSELDWVDSELLPTLLTAPTVGEFRRTWADGRQRLVAADQQLFVLSQRAPGEAKSGIVSGLRAAMYGLIAATDNEARSSSSDPEERHAAGANVTAAWSDFSSALQEAKGDHQSSESA